jgi:4-oxalocrotonate tautomerase
MPIVHIEMMEGRSTETKRRMVAAVTHALSNSLNAPPESVRIVIQELQPDHYAVGGVTAAEQPLADRAAQLQGGGLAEPMHPVESSGRG